MITIARFVVSALDQPTVMSMVASDIKVKATNKTQIRISVRVEFVPSPKIGSRGSEAGSGVVLGEVKGGSKAADRSGETGSVANFACT